MQMENENLHHLPFFCHRTKPKRHKLPACRHPIELAGTSTGAVMEEIVLQEGLKFIFSLFVTIYAIRRGKRQEPM